MGVFLAIAIAGSSREDIALGADSFASGNWKGGSYYDPAGHFTHCAMFASHKSGISLLFSLNRDFGRRVAHASGKCPFMQCGVEKSR
jgi:hypothetical protein